MNSEHDNKPCPCGSGKTYQLCCQPFHLGQLPETALQLMRSRYSAYALNLPAYIISTTHPDNPHFDADTAMWTKNISSFCLNTSFDKLGILDHQPMGNTATVTFTAHLTQNKKNASFTERSYFVKVNGKWLYHNGQFIQPSP